MKSAPPPRLRAEAAAPASQAQELGADRPTLYMLGKQRQREVANGQVDVPRPLSPPQVLGNPTNPYLLLN